MGAGKDWVRKVRWVVGKDWVRKVRCGGRKGLG